MFKDFKRLMSLSMVVEVLDECDQLIPIHLFTRKRYPISKMQIPYSTNSKKLSLGLFFLTFLDEP